MNQLEEIKARVEKTTPGPWKVWGMQVLADPVGDSNVDTALPIADTTDPHRGLRTFNAEFIAHARTDVPRLIAALEAVEDLHWRHSGRWTDSSGIPWIGEHCAECLDGWPCATAAAIAEALQ